jgi:hypothetical protein
VYNKTKFAPIFSRGSRDKDFWGALAEKGFAKLYGNYAQLVAGDTQEVWRMLAGSPTGVYRMRDFTNRSQDLWDMLKQTFNSHYLHMGHLN